MRDGWCAFCERPIDPEIGVLRIYETTPRGETVVAFCSHFCALPWLAGVIREIAADAAPMMPLHAVLRDDLQHLELRLERIEFECRQLRALVSTMRLLADDIQTLEEEDPMAPGPDAGGR